MAGTTSFVISMILTAVNQMSPAITQAVRNMRMYQNIINEVNRSSNKESWFNTAIQRAEQFGKKLKDAQDSMEKLVKSGEKNIFAGTAMALPLVGAIKSAANVENIQTSLRLTGMSQTEVENLTKQAQETMRRTMFSTSEVLGIDRALAQVGMDYKKIQSVGTTATYLAELEANRNGADPNETAKQFAQITEQLGISLNPQKVNEMADMVNRIATVTSASIATLSDSSRYFNLVGKVQGLRPEDIMMTQGLAARFGLEGSIGGTHLKDFFERLNPYTHMGPHGSAQLEAFAQLGWLKGVQRDKKGKIVGFSGDVFHDEKGNLVGADKIFSILGETYKKAGNKEQFNALMTRIFGQQGQDIAAAIGQNPEAFAMLVEQMSKVLPVENQITEYQKTFKQQFHALTSTLADFGRQIGTIVLPGLTSFITRLNTSLPAIQGLIDKHKGLIKGFVYAWGALAGFKIGKGVFKIAIGAPLKDLIGFGRLLTGIGKSSLKVARDVKGFIDTFRYFKQGSGFVSALWKSIAFGRPVLGRLTAMMTQFGTRIGVAFIKLRLMTGNALSFLAKQAVMFGVRFHQAFLLASTRVSQFGLRMGAALGKAGLSLLSFTTRGLAQVAIMGARFIWLGAQAMAMGIRMAAAWLIGLGPVGWIITGVIALVVAFIAAWKTNFLGFRTWLIGFWNGVRTVFWNFVTWVKTVGTNIVQGIWEGIQSMGSWLASNLKSFVSNYITGPIKSLLGIHSPSRVFAGYGVNIVQGLSNGINDNARRAEMASRNLAKRVAIAPGINGGTRGGSSSRIHVEQHYHIQSTDPKKAAREASRLNDKYWRSRDPRLMRA
jgi:TP901 family phage tail tape measure protein